MGQEMRTLHETARGCGFRKDGALYLTGEPAEMGTLPTCVVIDPPIPVDCDVIPFSRGVYVVNLDAVLTESDQRLWLAGSSKDSLKERDHRAWEIDRYGMTLHERLRIGICADLNPEQAEHKLMGLHPYKDVYLSDYINAIKMYGKGRRVAREVAVMHQARMGGDYKNLLASAWRLTGYSGEGEDQVSKNVQRIMVGIGALEDAMVVYAS